MPPGTDGDDEELVEIDVEIDGPPPLPEASAPELIRDGGDTEPNRGVASAEGPPPAPPDILEISDVVELQPPIVEAATDDPGAALVLYEAEASVADGGRKGALLLEVARLRELRAGADDSNAALEPARAAFATDPASMPALWLLRRLLVRGGGWEELAAIYEQAIQAPSSASDPGLRAELLITAGPVAGGSARSRERRGRLLPGSAGGGARSPGRAAVAVAGRRAGAGSGASRGGAGRARTPRGDSRRAGGAGH